MQISHLRLESACASRQKGVTRPSTQSHYHQIMKSFVTFGALFLTVVALVGCDATSGTASRIQEKSAVFAQLTPEQKQRVEAGSIERGYTADMVYMALGKPSKVREKDSPDGTVVMWTYNNFYSNNPDFAPDADRPERFSSGRSVGREQGVDNLAELPPETLHILFHGGKVIQIKLEE